MHFPLFHLEAQILSVTQPLEPRIPSRQAQPEILLISEVEANKVIKLGILSIYFKSLIIPWLILDDPEVINNFFILGTELLPV